MSVLRRPWPPPSRIDADGRFLRYWLLWVTLGEVVGLIFPALTGYVFAGSTAVVPALILAGAAQGAVLGWTQGTLLAFRLPGLNRLRWVAATASGAAVAWFVGLLPGEWADIWQRWPLPGQLIAALLVAAVLLGAVGWAQGVQLRGHLRGALWWAAGTPAAWVAGAGVFAGVGLLWRGDQSVATVALIGVLAGILAALTVSLLTGLLLLRLARRPGRPPRRNESPSQRA